MDRLRNGLLYRVHIPTGVVNAITAYSDYDRCLDSCSDGWMPISGYIINRSLEGGEDTYHLITEVDNG